MHLLALTKAEKKIIVSVLSILTAMCTLAYVAHKKSKQLISSSEKIEQADEIKYRIKEIATISVDMESGVRGFIMTGDESYLRPTNEVIADIFDHLRQLSASPAITEKQNEQIAQLRKLVDEKSTYTVRAAEVRRQKGTQEAMLFITEGRDKFLMNQIRNITDSMLKEADANLASLKTQNREYISHFAITFYLLLLKISITVITVVFLFFLYFRKRNRTEKELKESHELFQNVLDHTSSVISIKDLSGRFFLINQAYEKLGGKNREDVKGQTAYDLFSKEEADKIRHSYLEVIR